MQLPPLISATLVQRYKRFLADVRLENGELITAHCPNTGSMKQCSQPGRPIYLSRHQNPRRKYEHTWELIHMPQSLVGINTQATNLIVREALQARQVDLLKDYDRVQAEVKIANNTRIDFMLSGANRENCYLEVKNCTLVQEGQALFPDAITQRGQRHLQELIALSQAGYQAAIFFLVQRSDACSFSPAQDIDPVYSQLLRQAREENVHIMAYDVDISMQSISIRNELPCSI